MLWVRKPGDTAQGSSSSPHPAQPHLCSPHFQLPLGQVLLPRTAKIARMAPSGKPKPQRVLGGVLQTAEPSSVISEIQLPRFAPAEAKNHSNSNLKKTCLPKTPCQGTPSPELCHRLTRTVLVWATSWSQAVMV